MPKKSKKDLSRKLIQNLDIEPGLRFRIEEAYKSIRTNIAFSVMKEGCKRVVVTSSLASEGKTTTTINLAISFAQAGQRVLLIDADLRKPKVHQYFSVPNSPGLTNYLGASVQRGGSLNVSSVIHNVDCDNLSVICSGSIPPNPSEILGSEAMNKFLDEVSKMYDYIIMDTPPILVVSDALPIIKSSDGVVLVVRQNSSTHPEIQKALSSLEFIDAKLLGFIVNFAESDGKTYYKYGKKSYRYGYGGYSGYSYGYGYSPNDKRR